jgi:hypothetical protein
LGVELEHVFLSWYAFSMARFRAFCKGGLCQFADWHKARAGSTGVLP